MRTRRLLLPVRVNGAARRLVVLALAVACGEPAVGCGGGTVLTGDAGSDDSPTDENGVDVFVDADADAEAEVEAEADAVEAEATPVRLCAHVEHDIAVPGDFPTIREALAAAADGADICVEPGIYQEQIDFLGKAVRLFGVAGAERTILVAEPDAPVVVFRGGEGAGTVFEGFTVRQALTTGDGGGIIVTSSSPTLARLIVRDNYAESSGGGILLADSSASLTDVQILANGAGSSGGGIAIRGGTAALVRVHIEGNFADSSGGGAQISGSAALLEDCEILENGCGGSGGGMYVDGGAPSLTRVHFADNYSDYSGGGLQVASSATVTLRRVAFAGNRAEYEGGGAMVDGNATFAGVTFVDNEAGYEGGGLAKRGGDVGIDDGLFVRNRAGYEGGGTSMDSTSVALRNVRFVANEADRGGGLSVVSTSGTLANAVFAANVATFGGAAMNSGSLAPNLENVVCAGNAVTGSDGPGGTILSSGRVRLRDVVVAGHRGPGGALVVELGDLPPSATFCAFWDNGPTPFVGMTDPTGSGGNITVDPGFLDIAGTDAELWDLHLRSGSALIDAGASDVADPDGSRSDIGAYGGPGAGGWDLDGDGSPEWWQPGPYDGATYPAAGWDCDDLDPLINASAGC